MATTTTPGTESFTASELTQRTMLDDLMSQKALIGGAAFLALLFIFRPRGEDESEKAARKLVRDFRKVDSLEDGRDHLQHTLVPILRPALLLILAELQSATHAGFRRLNHEIKRL